MRLKLPKIPSFFISFGIMNLLKSEEAEKLIKENANKLDALIDAEFPNKSEEIQETIVSKVLLALGKELMKESPRKYYSLLAEETRRIQAEMNKGNPYL